MANCFERLVGLSNIPGCDCDGRPDGTATVEQMYYEVFVADTPADPLVLTLTYKLPASKAYIELFEDGVRVEDARISGMGTKSLSILDGIAGTYQVWYKANVSAISSIPAWNTSQSGLFISDLLPESELTGLANCDQTVWDLVAAKRTLAIKQFIGSLNSEIQKKFKRKHTQFSGFIGKPEYDGYLSTPYAFAGIRIRTNPIKSGYFRINRINALFEKSGTIYLNVYSADGTVMTPTIELRAIGNRTSGNSVGLTLPMLGDFNSVQDYYLVYSYDPDNKPKLNKTYCPPCSGGQQAPITYVDRYGSYNEWPTEYRGALAWNNYVIVGGWEGDSVADFSDAPINVGGYMNGLTLEVEIGCDLSAGLCKMLEGGGPEIMAAATVIQNTTASLLVESKRISSKPDRKNIAKGEVQSTAADGWEADAAETMAYLVSTVTEDANDCVICKPRTSMGEIYT